MDESWGGAVFSARLLAAKPRCAGPATAAPTRPHAARPTHGFRSAWAALRELAADPQHLGAHVGAVMALRAWGQNLQFQPHVHAVVPGGG